MPDPDEEPERCLCGEELDDLGCCPVCDDPDYDSSSDLDEDEDSWDDEDEV